MERTLSVNYPVQRQNKGVLLNTFIKKPQSLDSFLYILCIYLSLLASCIDVQCYIFQSWCFSNVFNNTPLFFRSVLSIYLVSSLTYIDNMCSVYFLKDIDSTLDTDILLDK